MKITNLLIVFIILIGLSTISSKAEQKLAQSGLKFNQVTTDSKIAAMGDACIGIEGDASAVFLNPASMARQTAMFDVALGSMTFIADFKYSYGAVSFAPENGLFGVIAFSFLSVDYGKDFVGSIYSNVSSGYQLTGNFNPTAYTAGLSYAKALNDKFSIGGTIKYTSQDLTNAVTGVYKDANQVLDYDKLTYKSYKPTAMAYDFGLLFHTGFQSLDFGASFRNFSQEIKLEKDNYLLPLTFKVGLAYNLSDLIELDKKEHSLQLVVDAVHNRDYPEQVNIGFEYKIMNMVALRCGYSAPNDEHNLAAGFGVILPRDTFGVGLSLDYAYTPWTVFEDVHQLTLHFNM